MLLTQPQAKIVDYLREPIMHDESFRSEMLQRIGEIGLAVEQACGGEPQDIEGAVVGDKYYVVQTRTQV